MSGFTVTNYFSWIDYMLFSSALIISALIGVYFGFFGKKQNSRSEYLHGGKSMKYLPVAASLIATDISGIALLALPAEIYLYGCTFWLSLISVVISSIIICFVSLPVFYKLKYNSSFEYLKYRYDNKVCVLASVSYLFNIIVLLPIVIYIPALAFSQVSGINLNIVIPIVCIICIFYTSVGGMKAVVWTDTIQMFIMLGSLLTVVGLGIKQEGGFSNIWHINDLGDRIDFNLDPDPTSRTSSIAIIIGIVARHCTFGNFPGHVQRYLAVPSLSDAKKVIALYTIGGCVFKSFSIFVGLVMYARYAGCDPVTAGAIEKPDQMVPYYIMNMSNSISGLPGLFVAGIFCAALSTMSTGLNTLSGTIYQDLVSPRMPSNISEKRISDILKIISVIIGLIGMVGVFLVQFLGSLFQLTLKVTSIVGGPILAMYALGMLTTFVNTKGILYGTLGSVISVSFILIGSTYYAFAGLIRDNYKPFSIEECPFNVSTIFYNSTVLPEEDLVPYPFRITFYYYSVIGVLVTALIAIPVSLKTGGNKQIIDTDLLSPVIYPYISEKHKSKLRHTEKIHREETELMTNEVIMKEKC